MVVSHCIPEVIIFRCLMRLSETPPPKKKKAVKVLGDFLGVVEMFVYLSPFGSLSPTFSLSQDFLLSRLQELIEILGEAGLAI